MNILIYGYRFEEDVETIETIIKNLDAKKFVLITEIPENKFKIKPNVYINLQELTFDEINFDKIIEQTVAIDGDVLERMSSGELIFFEISERLAYLKGRTIGYRERKNLFNKHLKFFINLLGKYEIEKCIFDFIPHGTPSYLLYETCKAINIGTAMSWFLPIIEKKCTYRYFFSDIYNQLPHIEKEISALEELYKDSCAGEIKLSSDFDYLLNYYKQDKKKIVQLITIDQKEKKFQKFVHKTARVIKGACKGNKWEKYRAYQYIKKTFRVIKAYKFYDRHAVTLPKNAKFIYFPLHYQPECTSLPMGRFFFDQLLIVDMIASALPEDVCLMVKSHPSASSYMTDDFFREIIKYKNTFLLDRKTNSYDAIDYSCGVATITGTAGWEALVRKKPVLMFGYYFYQYAKGVFHIKNNDDCIYAIKKILSNQFEINEKDTRIFLKAFEKYAIPGYIDLDYSRCSNISIADNVKLTAKGYSEFCLQKKIY